MFWLRYIQCSSRRFRHPKSEESQYIREVCCFKTAEKRILDSDKNTHVTHVYDYIKS